MKQLSSISQTVNGLKAASGIEPSPLRVLPQEAHALLARLEGWAETSMVPEGALLAR